jgi:Fe-S-cluster-containing dehydrogenase component/anaerobic selenocysteine-containing dehydrogenase
MKPDRFPLPVWRSLDERHGVATAAAPGEFPQLGRRELLKLAGATAALATAACNKPPEETLLPYQHIPEGLTAGNAQHYATALALGGEVTAVLATAREGRPVKLEGHPDHPMVRGALGPLEQAQLLTLYDPERARLVKHRGKPESKRGFLDAVAQLVSERKDGGRGVRFVSEPTGSPLLESLRGRIAQKLPQAQFVSWTAVSGANRYAGARLAFGRPLEPLYDFSKARVVLSLDADFLEARGPHLAHARAWAERRRPGADMSRLYVAEPSFTVTGSVADHRLRLKGSAVESLLREVIKPGSQQRTLSEHERAWAAAVRQDLSAAQHEALVVVGDRQAPAVHALAHALHHQFGTLGTTVRLVAPAVGDVDHGPEALARLAEDIERKAADLVVITAWNPAYASCVDLDLAKRLAAVTTVYLGAYVDETAAAATWFLPRAHALESWADHRALDGSVVFQQPIIEPLFSEVMSEVQLYAAFAGEAETPPLKLLKSSWMQRQGVPPGDAAAEAGFDTLWSQWLQQGGVPNSAAPDESPQLDAQALTQVPQGAPIEGFELALVHDYKLLDGRGDCAGWLLELPDPMTKLVWDNAAVVSPATAARLKVTPGLDGKAGWSKGSPRVSLSIKGPHLTSTLEAPLFVLPGHADDVVTLALGWGRDVGVNAYRLQQTHAPHFAPVEVRVAEGGYPLVTTQEHWTMDGRETALEEKRDALDGMREKLEHLNGVEPTLQQPYDYSKAEYRWGMAIDLNVCTGCSACVTACQAENNIPVVGKEAVWRNREMFWIRVDRYFTGTTDDPGVITQPVTCQQCEYAPCEYVCPVAATSHSDEGLNDQVYNRCIGTRYCENNCPYKVRRFNYFDFRKDLKPLEQLAMNPDVTVRRRGVMEMCTFCSQRIERARIETRREGRSIADGTLATACQQACPTQAITFGSLNDAQSSVSRRHRDARRYDLLHDLGTRPRNAFLVRIKNPNPELA